MNFTCDNCRRSYTGARAYETVTGRLLCQRCDESLWGLATGRMIDNPEDGSTMSPSIFRRFRDRRRS